MKKTKMKKKKIETKARAHGRYLKISPTKVRDILDLIRGESVTEAERILKFSRRRGARAALKVLVSAQANAGVGTNKEGWVVTEASADKGPRFRRRLDPKPRGQAGLITTYSTHLTMGVGFVDSVPQKKEEPKKVGSEGGTKSKRAKKPVTKKKPRGRKKEVKNAA
jgi:large subunit ribosomal protein L22